MRRFLIAGAVVLAASAIYLFAFPLASLFYEGIVLLHILLGAVTLLIAVPWGTRLLRNRGVAEKLGWILFLIGGGAGAVILYTGARRGRWPVLYTHELISALACALLLFVWLGHRGRLTGSFLRGSLRLATCLALVAAVAAGAWFVLLHGSI